MPPDPEEERRLRSLIADIEGQIDGASAAERGRLHNQAGDLYTRLGDRKESLTAYGHAIDAYIDAGKLGVARGLCTKILRNYPNVTRVHFTLACLALHQGLREEAVHSIAAYVAAAVVSSTHTFAIPRLKFLAQGVSDPVVREVIARELRILDDNDPLPAYSEHMHAARPTLLLDAARVDSEAMWASFWLK